MSTTTHPIPTDLYRLPWNLTHNAISWLEPTSFCNLACEGCYRQNRPGSHKTLDEIEHELEVFKRLRKCDSVSIAGGEPLAHPEIGAIVRLVRQRGWKPVVNTNGALLTPGLLRELVHAGVAGFTFHVDSGQNRPGWKDASESDLNELRLQLAALLATEGSLTCSFNATVYPGTLKEIPGILSWAREHIDVVHVLVFILYRSARLASGFDYYAGAERVCFGEVVYGAPEDDINTFLRAQEALDAASEGGEPIEPCAYLGGTEQPSSFKWLLAGRVGARGRIYGHVGPKFMEIVQAGHHAFTGRYLAYASPPMQRRGRLMFLAAPFDAGVRRIMRRYLASLFSSPVSFFRRLRFQSVLVIQPADVDETGLINMCDGCPDITVWDDRLVWSCRLEEQLRWGCNIRLAKSGPAVGS